MENFCCFPLSNTPDFEFDVNCSSTCCVARNQVQKTEKTESRDEVDGEVTTEKAGCCFRKRQAKQKKEEKEV